MKQVIKEQMFRSWFTYPHQINGSFNCLWLRFSLAHSYHFLFVTTLTFRLLLGFFGHVLWICKRRANYRQNKKNISKLQYMEFYVNVIKMHSMASIKHVLIQAPDDETDSLKRRWLVLSVACLWVFFHLMRSSSIKSPFLPSVPCRRSPTYSSISSAFSMDKIYLDSRVI